MLSPSKILAQFSGLGTSLVEYYPLVPMGLEVGGL